jgi:hypothetical protein
MPYRYGAARLSSGGYRELGGMSGTMIYHYLFCGAAFLALFILFLVISRTLNNIINHLSKLEYVITREHEFVDGQIRIAREMKERVEKERAREEERLSFESEKK